MRTKKSGFVKLNSGLALTVSADTSSGFIVICDRSKNYLQAERKRMGERQISMARRKK